MDETIIIFQIFEDSSGNAYFAFIRSLGTLRVHECDVLKFLT